MNGPLSQPHSAYVSSPGQGAAPAPADIKAISPLFGRCAIRTTFTSNLNFPAPIGG